MRPTAAWLACRAISASAELCVILPVYMNAVYCGNRVCVSACVCVFVGEHYLKSRKSEIHQIFCARCLWPWLSPLLTALQ